MRYALWPVRQHALALRDSDMIRVISRYCGNGKKSIKLMFKVQLYSTRREWCPRTGLRAAVNEYFCG